MFLESMIPEKVDIHGPHPRPLLSVNDLLLFQRRNQISREITMSAKSS